MQRFPARTLVLMGLALLSFLWMFWNSHRVKVEVAPPKALSGQLIIVPLDGGGP